MKRPLQMKIILVISVIVLLIDICCIIFNYQKYISVNKDYTDSLAETIANTCTLVIDGDRVTNYLNTRQRDTQYYEIWNKLIDYRNTNPDIVKLSVINFDETGGHYVFDTNLEETGAFLGDICAFDATQERVKDSLIQCAEIASLQYAQHTDIYIPIKSSYNIPVAYVIVGISTINVKMEQMAYLAELTMMVSLITIVFGILLILYMHRSVIRPINMLSKAAAGYAKSMEKGEKVSPLQQVKITTRDEIERLCDSMKKMENDILSSSASLVLATWNSQHDSMTQLYNKRFYLETLDSIKNEDVIGIIYLDIDNLKKMNDTFGHDMGDDVILKAAKVIHKYEESGYISCRVGGDEFVIFMKNSTADIVDDLVSRLRDDEESVLSDKSKEFYCRLAVGGALKRSGESITDAIKRAEEEMYGNKHSKR